MSEDFDPKAQAALAKSAAAAREAAKKVATQRAVTASSAPATADAPAILPDSEAGILPDRRCVIECEGVWQRYPSPSGGHQVILNDVSLRVPEHEFVSVVGPSGCGKSTLLRLILGSEGPWQGSVKADGAHVDHPDRRRGIVFQKYSLFPHLTVLENVMFGLELDGTWLLQKWLTWPWYRKQHKRHADEAMSYLETVKLHEHATKYPHQLSGGMQQRVAIAQAMIMRPTILLMDEPFGALDPGTREALQVAIVDTFYQGKTTIFFVTHDLEEALFVGRRLLVLSPFWRPSDGADAKGSKIVMDIACPHQRPTDVKKTAEFQEIIARVRKQGFDPTSRLSEDRFELTFG